MIKSKLTANAQTTTPRPVCEALRLQVRDEIVYQIQGRRAILAKAHSNVTFTGELRGDEIRFTRDIEIRPRAPRGGRWIFGEQGVREFTATRGG